MIENCLCSPQLTLWNQAGGALRSLFVFPRIPPPFSFHPHQNMLKNSVLGIAAATTCAVFGIFVFQRLEDMRASTELGFTLAGKNALVLGGTKGIGLGFAQYMATHGCRVTVVGRSSGQTVVDKLNQFSSGNDFLQADLSLLAESRRVVREYLEKHESLDYLILSQGIATLEGRKETPEGNDIKLSLHYYSRVQMALEAEEALAKSGGTALFVLSAGVHSPFYGEKSAENFQGADFGLKECYSLGNVANAAGFYTDLAIETLAERNQRARFIHAEPGFVASNWGEDLPTPVRWLVRGLQASVATSVEKCAEKLAPVVFLQNSPGWFLSTRNSKIIEPLDAQNEAIRKAVWEHTMEVINSTKD